MLLGRSKLINHYNRILFSFILTILLCGLIQIGPMTFISEASGTREFEVTVGQGTIPIPKNDYKFVDITFDEGEELEVVFIVQVKDNLPIDIFFVTDDNYYLLSQNAQFLFLIDGTGQEVSYAKRIVTLTEHDDYKIVMTNFYVNQSVEVDITYELRTYGLESEDESPDYPDMMVYTLIIVMIIIGVLLVLLFMLVRKLKHAGDEKSNRSFTGRSGKNRHAKANRKDKAHKKKAKQKKAVDPKPEEVVKAPVKKVMKIKSEKTGTKVPEDAVGTYYCGYCGTQNDTPFCKQCGKKN